jgi:hypothetical protein
VSWWRGGVTLEGRKLLLGLALGSRESYENWRITILVGSSAANSS